MSGFKEGESCPNCGKSVIKYENGIVIRQTDSHFMEENWRVVAKGRCFYAFHQRGTGNKRKGVYLHRLILPTKEGFVVDHIDGNGLNNCRCNLRSVTAAENKKNRIHSRANFRPFISKYGSSFRVFHGKKMFTTPYVYEAIEWRDGLRQGTVTKEQIRKITKRRQKRGPSYARDLIQYVVLEYKYTKTSTRKLAAKHGVSKSQIALWIKGVI